METRQYPVGSFGSLKPRYVNGVLVLPGLPRQLRVRATTAQVNAGLEVLPALPGFGYRITNAAMIAIGGAATGATSVDLLGTKAGSASRPVVITVAALTQSTMVQTGAVPAAGAVTLLADGASFTKHDNNTALSITKQSGGSALATATHVDLLLDYVVE
jgi:hypothetical protein